MNKFKKWIILWFFSILTLLLVGLINYIVDPYQQYRKATFYKVPYEKERELNAGLAKNFDYDSVVLGTSMMENFNIYDLQTILNYQKPIKLTMAGSSVYEQQIILSTALRHQKIKNVLWGIDFLSYYGKEDRLKHGETFFPEYLYDENKLNDYKYLLSSNTISRVFEIFLKDGKDVWLYNYSKMYEWKSKTNDENILLAIRDKWEHRDQFDNEATDNEKKLDFLIANFNYNLKPIIESNQDTNFILFFPPYSILANKVYQERRQLKDFIQFKIYIIQNLSHFKNVKIYDFQTSKEITYNLSNYYDLYHYNKSTSKWILKQIKQDKNNVLKTNYLNSYGIFFRDVSSYDLKEAF